jgi:pyruvate-ferredoxin/flavodoxin oxidoreductase
VPRPGRRRQLATLRSRVPFIHFFDGFRTSHELNTLEMLSDDDLRAYVPESLIIEHRDRALSPEHPYIRGTAQNPDTYFQSRETVNPYYDKVPGIVSQAMDEFAELTGRQYHLIEYHGAPDAERVIIIMGSGAQSAMQAVDHLNADGRKVGVLQVRLYRPLPTEALLAAIPETVSTHRGHGPHEGARCGRRALFLDVTSRWPRPSRRDAAPPCRGSSAAATACPARSSPPAW